MDTFPKLKKYRIILIGSLCSAMYLLGLPYCTRVTENLLLELNILNLFIICN